MLTPPQLTCATAGGIVMPSVCDVNWNSFSAFDFRVLVTDSQAFIQLWCRHSLLGSPFQEVARLGQLTTAGLAANSTNRYVFKIPTVPPLLQASRTGICAISFAIVPIDQFDNFGTFNPEFTISDECNDYQRSRGCECAAPPLDPSCAANYVCENIVGVASLPNICVEQQFVARGYQAGNSVIIPPAGLSACVRLTGCTSCNSRTGCQWCGSQCIDTNQRTCRIAPNTTCKASPSPTAAPPETRTPDGPSGTVPPQTQPPPPPETAPTTADSTAATQASGTLFVAPTTDAAPGGNVVAIAAGAGGGAVLLLVIGIVALVCWLKRKKARGGKLDEDTAMSRYSDAPSAQSSQSYTRPAPPTSMYGSTSSDYGAGPLAASSDNGTGPAAADYQLAPPPSSSSGSDYAKASAPNVLYANGAFACPQCGKTFPTEGDVQIHKSKRGH